MQDGLPPERAWWPEASLSQVLVRNFLEPPSGLLFGAEAWCRGERKGKEFLTGDGRDVVMNAHQINIGGLFDDLPEPLAVEKYGTVLIPRAGGVGHPVKSPGG